jgi:hypothetical protein
MSNLTLQLGAHSFHIRKKHLIDHSELFDIHPELYDERSYDARSAVAVDSCEAFSQFLQTQDNDLVTAGNCSDLAELATETGVPDLVEFCAELEAGQRKEILIDELLVLEESASQQTEVCEGLERDLRCYLCDFLADKFLRFSDEIRDLAH